MSDLCSVHLTSVIVDDVSFRINMNSVFEFTVAHETHSSCRCSRELNIDCKISALDHVKMVGGPAYVRTEVSTTEVKPINKLITLNIVTDIIKHLSSTREQGKEGFDVSAGCCSIGEL